DDSEIKGVGPALKTVLVAHNVATAADLGEIKELTMLPSISKWRAESLLKWRRGLERQFVFDPARDVSLEARVRTERDVDSLRAHVESELSGGARSLRHVELEIEARRQKLRPALEQARRELAQAEKDLAVASKRNSALLILFVLTVAFIIGLTIVS